MENKEIQLGVAINGVVAEEETCIGCGEIFIGFRLEKETREEWPVCGDCAETMRP